MPSCQEYRQAASASRETQSIDDSADTLFPQRHAHQKHRPSAEQSHTRVEAEGRARARRCDGASAEYIIRFQPALLSPGRRASPAQTRDDEPAAALMPARTTPMSKLDISHVAPTVGAFPRSAVAKMLRPHRFHIAFMLKPPLGFHRPLAKSCHRSRINLRQSSSLPRCFEIIIKEK